MEPRHIVSASSLDLPTLRNIFTIAEKFKKSKTNTQTLKGKIMATLFYEPSTRTRLSFESAMLRLGGSVISTENAKEFSSTSKGESLADTIKVVNQFSDVIVLRHFNQGASYLATKYSKKPIINAGDGKGEHPTQALLDLYTIVSHFGVTKNLEKNLDITISMVGDLKNGRTIHSLCYLLSLFKKVNIIFVAPRKLKITKIIKDYLSAKKVRFSETSDFIFAAKQSDVIYQTRIQKERFDNLNEYNELKNKYIINLADTKHFKKISILMHPLPRVGEIHSDVDDDPRAVYFEQVQNGLFVRMGLLKFIFGYC